MGENKESLLYGFGQGTTLHGVKHLTDDSAIIRKLLWLVLVITGLVLTIIQVKQKALVFMKNPIATNIDISYPRQLSFPSVVVCNLNPFRVSKTWNTVYNMLDDVFYYGDEFVNDMSIYAAETAKLGNIDSAGFVRLASHQIEDMLIECTWPGGGKCSAEDFEPVMTDFGLCFTINSNKTNTTSSRSAGVTNGLKMKFNIQQYEYIRTSTDTAGLKVLLHDQNSLPMVGLRALDVPPGFFSLIGMNYREFHKLSEEEGGSCVVEQDMTHYSKEWNSLAACKMDHYFTGIGEKCNCSAFNAPTYYKSRNGTRRPPVCTVEQHFGCVFQSRNEGEDDHVNCKENCSSIEYRPILSMSQLPFFEFKPEVQERIARDYDVAKEAQTRADIVTQNIIQPLLSDLFESFELMTFHRLDMSNFLPTFERLFHRVPCLNSFLQKHSSQFGSGNGSNFFDYWDRESTLDLLSENRIYLALHPETDLKGSEIIDGEGGFYFGPLADIKSQLGSLIDGINYIYSEFMSFRDVKTEVKEYLLLKKRLEEYKNLNLTLKTWAERAEHERYDKIETQLRTEVFAKLTEDLKYLHGFFDESGGFSGVEAGFHSTVDGDAVLQQLFGELLEMTVSDQHGSPEIKRNESCVAKMNAVSEALAAEKAAAAIAAFSVSLDSVPYPVPDPRLLKAGDVEAIKQFYRDNDWDFGIDQLVLACPFKLRYNATSYFEEFSACVAGDLKPVLGELHQEIEMAESKLNEAVLHMSHYLEKYKSDYGTTTDKFFSKNILGLNIYYQDLSKEIMTQERSYDIFSLACDAGGTFGLFLGASILTIFEFVDFFCIQPLINRCNTRKKISSSGGDKQAAKEPSNTKSSSMANLPEVS